MGLCISRNREYTRLCRMNNIESRTFDGLTCLAKLVSIYDGDTFKIIMGLISGELFYLYSVRLAGIDTPEVRPTQDTPDRELHKKAGLYVKELLRMAFPEGTIFYIDFQKEEKYGRLLGTICTTKKSWLGTIKKHRNICQGLLDMHLALPYKGQSKSPFSVEMLDKMLCIHISYFKNQFDI